MERITATAQVLVDRLRDHPAVEVVALRGPRRAALVRRARTPRPRERSRPPSALIANATSLGGVDSVIESRARWEGDRVPAGLLRLSVGLEDADVLWADLAQALP